MTTRAHRFLLTACAVLLVATVGAAQPTSAPMVDGSDPLPLWSGHPSLHDAGLQPLLLDTPTLTQAPAHPWPTGADGAVGHAPALVVPGDATELTRDYAGARVWSDVSPFPAPAGVRLPRRLDCGEPRTRSPPQRGSRPLSLPCGD